MDVTKCILVKKQDVIDSIRKIWPYISDEVIEAELKKETIMEKDEYLVMKSLFMMDHLPTTKQNCYKIRNS